MTSPNPPLLGLGFEFEWWEATLYDDLKEEDYPYKGDRDFVLAGKKSHDGKKQATKKPDGGFREGVPAPTDWNPNEGRMPDDTVVQGMLNQLRETVAKALGKESLVSNLKDEHPVVGPLVDGVSSAFTKYTAHRDKGRERNLSDNTWRKDSHVCEDWLYFVALELRTRVYTQANQGGGGEQMRKELEAVLNLIPKRHHVSINAGNDAFYKLSPEFSKGHNKTQPGEARAGTHIHVSVEGIFDTATQRMTKNGHPRCEEIKDIRMLASKKILTLYWLVEPEIRKLHASWRSEDARYSGLLRHHSNLAFHLRSVTQEEQAQYEHWEHEAEKKAKNQPKFYDHERFKEQGAYGPHDLGPEAKRVYDAVMARLQDARDREAIEKIWMCKEMDQLVWLCTSYFSNRRAALSLNQLVETNSNYEGGGLREPKQRLGTVEYRAMQGSFDPEAVIAWSDVVMKMTEACVTRGPDVFVDFVDRLMQPPERGDTVRAFIQRLGFDGQSRPYKFYSDKLQERLDREARPRFDKESYRRPHVFVEPAP